MESSRPGANCPRKRTVRGESPRSRTDTTPHVRQANLLQIRRSNGRDRQAVSKHLARFGYDLFMSYEKKPDRSQVFLLPPSLDDWVPEDHPARFIDAFVESLDLPALGFEVGHAPTGRPRYSAQLLLSVYIYCYFDRIRSLRRMERACLENVALMWLTGNERPDHNTLWRFFGDNKKAIRKVLKQSVKVAVDANLVGMVLHAVDGTKIEAQASSKTAYYRKQQDEALKRVDFSIAEMERLLGMIHEVQMGYWEKTLEIVGDNIDIVMHSDDLGMQNSPMMSPDMYRRFVKPLHQELIHMLKKKAKGEVKFLLHSCGSVRALIPDFIDVGVDILNPIQVSAAGMDTAELKKEFGKDMCFCGGGVDTQEILPRGTPEQVRDEVKRRLDDLAPGGGYIFAAVHNIQADVPPENLQAMYEAFQEHGRY